jgi:hypothetical protein
MKRRKQKMGEGRKKEGRREEDEIPVFAHAYRSIRRRAE